MKLFRKQAQPVEPSRRELVKQRRAAAAEQTSGATYVRNRTLSAHTQPDGSSERQQLRDLHTRRRKLLRWLSTSAGALVLIGVILTQFTAELRISTPAPLKQEESARYMAVMQDYLREQPLERLRFLTNLAALHAHFLEHASEVQSVEIVGDGLGVGVLQVSFRQPVVQWSVGDKAFFVDASGVTFERNYFTAPDVHVDDQSGVPPEMGQEIINRQFLSFLGRSVALFKQQGVKIERVVLPEGTVRTAEFFAEQTPYGIRMTVDRSAEAQVREAMYMMRFVDEQQFTPEYIDVRVDQRVFYT